MIPQELVKFPHVCLMLESLCAPGLLRSFELSLLRLEVLPQLTELVLQLISRTHRQPQGLLQLAQTALHAAVSAKKRKKKKDGKWKGAREKEQEKNKNEKEERAVGSKGLLKGRDRDNKKSGRKRGVSCSKKLIFLSLLTPSRLSSSSSSCSPDDLVPPPLSSFALFLSPRCLLVLLDDDGDGCGEKEEEEEGRVWNGTRDENLSHISPRHSAAPPTDLSVSGISLPLYLSLSLYSSVYLS